MGLEVRIASPCSANWNQMAGDDRVRFCPECQRNVYNFSSMTEAEVKRLVAQTEGRLCGRFYQRPDGTMLAKNCPIGFRGSILRATRMATATLAAVMSAAPSFAKPAAAGPDRVVPAVLLQIEAAHPSVSIAVTDKSGAPIPDAEAIFLNKKTDEKTTGKANSEGVIQVTALAKGDYEVTVSSPGFNPDVVEVQVPHHSIVRVTLGIGLMGEVIAVTPANRIHRFFSRIFQSL
jgi:Carboxypeptidase regulatory-like domain